LKLGIADLGPWGLWTLGIVDLGYESLAIDLGESDLGDYG